MMVLPITMPERIASNTQSKQDHKALKDNIVNNIDPKYWKGGEYHWKNCAMDRASD